MMIAETEDIIVRPLQKNEAAPVANCDFSGEVFAYGDKEGCFAVISKHNRKLIGTIICPEEDKDLIMVIHKTERDMGYGESALSIALNFLFGSIGRSKVLASCSCSDNAAIKTLVNVGMEKIGETDDKQNWSITREQWETL